MLLKQKNILCETFSGKLSKSCKIVRSHQLHWRLLGNETTRWL